MKQSYHHTIWLENKKKKKKYNFGIKEHINIIVLFIYL